MDFGILLLRSVVGLTMAAHGAQKLFGWFGGPGLDKVALGFEQLGFVPGRRHARLAGLAEVGGGLLLALGLLTPVAGALILALMLVAALSVHLKGGFFLTSGGYEYNLVLGVAGNQPRLHRPRAVFTRRAARPAVHRAVLGPGGSDRRPRRRSGAARRPAAAGRGAGARLTASHAMPGRR